MPKGVYVRTNEMKEAMSRAHIGKSWGHHTDEAKAKIGKATKAALTGRKRQALSTETKRKISESNMKTHKEKWSRISDDEKYKLLENWIKAGCSKNKDTSIEIAVQNELNLLGIIFEKQKKFGKYFADIFIPKYNAIIECDGDYWHSFEDRKQHDKIRDEFLESEGLIVIRLPEYAIKKNAKELVNYTIKLLHLVCTN